MANVKSQDKAGASKSLKRSFGAKLHQWLRNNRSQLFLVLIVGISMSVYYFITGTEGFRKGFLPTYLHFLAEVTGTVLNLFGANVSVSTTIVQSKQFAMDIAYGCDALEPITLFTVVVAAFPARFKARISAIPVGIILLFMVNIVRLLTLYYAGSTSTELFELMHIEIWQPIFIVCALVMFILYVGFVRRKGWSNV